MRKFLIGVTAAVLAGGVALAQAQQGQTTGQTGQQEPAGGQGAGRGMGGGMMGQGQDMMGGQGMHGMMMGRGMEHGMMGRGMHGDRHSMKRHMMLMMFVLVDQDDSETLSLQEVQDVHARLFNYADANDDGELTMEELAAFMHGRAEPAGDAQ